jgi:hypothetical protein
MHSITGIAAVCDQLGRQAARLDRRQAAQGKSGDRPSRAFVIYAMSATMRMMCPGIVAALRSFVRTKIDHPNSAVSRRNEGASVLCIDEARDATPPRTEGHLI